MNQKSVLVIGANGYIGSAVCRAFTRAGWRVFGLIRRKEAAGVLALDETIPVVGSLSDPGALGDIVLSHSKTFDVIVGCTEPPEYVSHIREALAFVRHISEISNLHHVRPLVLWSSGCKDYGTTAVDGAPDLEAHTETSAINPPSVLIARATHSLLMLEQTDLFDAAVLRPTNVFGHSSSYYGNMFAWAASNAARGAGRLILRGIDRKSIMHAMHVDDCGEAYVALAENQDRAAVAGQCFNISARSYETAETVLNALAKEYGFPDGASFAPTVDGAEVDISLAVLFGFSQWVGSDKIRTLTSWSDRRMLFSENLGVYRRSYEAAVAAEHQDLARVQARQTIWQKKGPQAD